MEKQNFINYTKNNIFESSIKYGPINNLNECLNRGTRIKYKYNLINSSHDNIGNPHHRRTQTVVEQTLDLLEYIQHIYCIFTVLVRQPSAANNSAITLFNFYNFVDE